MLVKTRSLRRNIDAQVHGYTEYAGLEIPVFLCIASSFSRQIANGNAGPSSALESMGAKRPFGCIF